MQEQNQTPDIKNDVPVIQEEKPNYAMIIVVVVVLVAIVLITAPFFFMSRVVNRATEMRDDQESEMIVEPTENLLIKPTKSKKFIL